MGNVLIKRKEIKANDLVFISQGQHDFTWREKLNSYFFNGHMWKEPGRPAEDTQEMKVYVGGLLSVQKRLVILKLAPCLAALLLNLLMCQLVMWASAAPVRAWGKEARNTRKLTDCQGRTKWKILLWTLLKVIKKKVKASRKNKCVSV